MRKIQTLTSEAAHNNSEAAFVKELAPQYDITVAQFERWAIRYVLDNVSHNDFMTYVLQQKDATDARRYGDADARTKPKENTDAEAE